jgi:hypothetical protein
MAVGVLTLRRIVFPPDLGDPASWQFGVLVGLAGALCAVRGGLIDTGRDVVERYPAVAFWRPPAGARTGVAADAVAQVERPIPAVGRRRDSLDG